MRGRTNPIIRHRDHLTLLEELIAATQAAIGKQQQKINQVLREGAMSPRKPAPCARNAIRFGA
jgi:hypothetical protein